MSVSLNRHYLSMQAFVLYVFMILAAAPVVAQESRPPAIAPQPVPVAKPLLASDPAALVTEFDVNGLKVLVKRRENNQTVVAGLFVKGGA